MGGSGQSLDPPRGIGLDDTIGPTDELDGRVRERSTVWMEHPDDHGGVGLVELILPVVANARRDQAPRGGPAEK